MRLSNLGPSSKSKYQPINMTGAQLSRTQILISVGI